MKHMSEHENKSPNQTSEASDKSNRRRFLKQGAIIAPVITTLSSRPVWARGDGNIGSISGSLSGNLSNNTRVYDPKTYDGCSPGYWHKAERFPVQGHGFDIHYNTPFEDVFDDENNKVTTGISDTFIAIIGASESHKRSSGSSFQVERFAAASLLNAIADPSFPYPPRDIIAFYGEYHKGTIDAEFAKGILENLVHSGSNSGTCFIDETDENEQCQDTDDTGNTITHPREDHPHGKKHNNGGGNNGRGN